MEVPKAKERIPLSTHSQTMLGTAAPRSPCPRTATGSGGPGVGSDDLARAALTQQLNRQQRFPPEIRVSGQKLVEPYDMTVGEKQAKTDEVKAACLMLKEGKHETLSPSEQQFLMEWKEVQQHKFAEKEKKKLEASAQRDKVTKGSVKSLEAFFYAGGSLENIKTKVSATSLDSQEAGSLKKVVAIMIEKANALSDSEGAGSLTIENTMLVKCSQSQTGITVLYKGGTQAFQDVTVASVVDLSNVSVKHYVLCDTAHFISLVRG
jgi:hypothetical protein